MPLRAPTPAWPSTAATEERAVAGLRLLLAAAALLVVYIDPTYPERNVAATYAVLSSYAAASLLLYARSLRSGARRRRWLDAAHWADIACYLLLLALTGGASSLFFVLFFFPILVASFRAGFTAGMTATVVSAAGATIVGLLEARGPGEVELNRLVMRAVSLLVIGFVISSRGGFETLLRRRLALLKEIGRLSNPRLGTDRTIAASLERLREFCDADDCLLVATDAATGAARVRRAARGDPERARHEHPLPPELARQLLALAPDHALVYRASGRISGLRRRVQQYDVARGAPVPVDAAACSAIADWFAPASFITVPVLGRGGSIGRLYLASSGGRLRADDVEFLLHVVDCLLPLLENIRLVDRLAAGAAAEERQKIARDVHDSVIQPYIGLELGLAALLRQAEAAGETRDEDERAEILTSLHARLRRLLELTHGGVGELRGFLSRLRAGENRAGSFESIVSSYTRRFTELTGITVQVEVSAAPELDANDRLSAEIFQLIAEALSNVRRHSDGKLATVRVSQSQGALHVAIENDGRPGHGAAQWTPRSIADRARSLQGWTTVTERPEGGCLVAVEIPL
ncbi:MAG: hypothetical protein DCC71_14360 [Proteobacteria bacterium]|nr:MAG: hypothetical protein DCC71_14360 [Pseudomonadota bacterium]